MLTLFYAESMHIRMLKFTSRCWLYTVLNDCTSRCSDAHSDANSILCWINAHLDAHVHIWMLRYTFGCWLYFVLNQCTFRWSCAPLDAQMLRCTFGCWLYSVLNQCTFRSSHAHSDADCWIPINAICMFMHTSKLIAEKFCSNPVEGSTLYQHNKQL